MPASATHKDWLRRLLTWAASVLGLAIVAGAYRLLMSFAGLTS